jgi:hypothetical protein
MKEALQRALDALGPTPPECCGCQAEWQIAITAIKAALEAKDEPWEQFYPEMGKPKLAYLPPTESLENACYIPPQRTWVGLTDDEIEHAFKTNSVMVDNGNAYMVAGLRAVNIAQAIEAKLKEKNT